jgi:hypothetical protein
MPSESDPKPFYIRHNSDGTRDEYILDDDGLPEVVHRHVTPSALRSGPDSVREVQTWPADEFHGENVPARAKLKLQGLREALQRMRDVSNARRS